METQLLGAIEILKVAHISEEGFRDRVLRGDGDGSGDHDIYQGGMILC